MNKEIDLSKITKADKLLFLKKLSTGKYLLKPVGDFPAKGSLNAILIPKNFVVLTVSDNGDFIDEFGSIYSYEKIIKDEPGRVFLDEKAAKLYIEYLEKSC